jgi:hypothetical protein
VEQRAGRVALDVGVEAVAGRVGRELDDLDGGRCAAVAAQDFVPSGGFLAAGLPSGRSGSSAGRWSGTPPRAPDPFDGVDPFAPFAPPPSTSFAGPLPPAAPASPAGATTWVGPVPSAMRLIL